MVCYGRISANGWTQEWYETASKDAGKRARELRKLGYKVVTQSMGSQVTGIGRVKLSLVTIFSDNVPSPEHIEKI